MLDFHIMKDKVQSAVSIERFIHTLGVVETAEKLADLYGVDRQKARIAAILHDCAKDYPKEMKKRFCKEFHIPLDDIMQKQIDLVHSFLGAEVAKREYGVEDEGVLDAIRYHTTGRPNMSLIEKVIFLADYMEPNRRPFKGLTEIREMACKDIDHAMKLALLNTIEHVKQKKDILHPLTVEAYEFLKQNESVNL